MVQERPKESRWPDEPIYRMKCAFQDESVDNGHDSAEVIEQRSREPPVTNRHNVVLDIADVPFYLRWLGSSGCADLSIALQSTSVMS